MSSSPSHSKSSADCGQRLESTSHEAQRKTVEAIAKSHDEMAHGCPSAFHANQTPAHGFNETSLEMKDKLNPLDSPVKQKFPEAGFMNEKISAHNERLESVAHEEGRKAAEAIAKQNQDVSSRCSSPSRARRPSYNNESSVEFLDLLNPLDPPKTHAPPGAK